MMSVRLWSAALIAWVCVACGDDDGRRVVVTWDGSSRDVRVAEDTSGDATALDSDLDVGDAREVTGPPADGLDDAPDAARPPSSVPFEGLGARRRDGVTRVRVAAPHAERVEVWFYDAAVDAEEVATLTLQRDAEGIWDGEQETDALYYGLRVWGPNWRHDPAWSPGSSAGFISDVDDEGNRYNPNKLLLDPYALEVSHDPGTPDWSDWGVYRSGPEDRARDSASRAPKGVIIDVESLTLSAPRPTRHLRDDVIYEVHVRGLTMNDPGVPEALRGTYAGAALKAEALAALGVTAVEFLPLHETQNDRNDVVEDAAGDNYWGYASLSFFAPDRRYAADRSPGGPTREVVAMVDAFHAAGIKVLVDVVYNHTGEGGAWGGDGEYSHLLSWRGVDNAEWYHTVNGRGYRDDNGVGPNLLYLSPRVREGIMDSLAYWHETLGVDGFRFDLASVLGNSCLGDCFEFDPDGLLRELAERFARSADGATGADLIAEPWGVTPGTYQLGAFPPGWHEWNDEYRIALRGAINEPWAPPTPGDLALRLHGSSDVFRDSGRGPDAGIGYVVSHDGLTWADLFSCAEVNNDQPWPYGPSDGGTDFNQSSDHGGDPERQRQAARTAFALMAVSSGVPMLTGGDEFLRTQRCNNNAYNLDSIGNWLDWTAGAVEATRHTRFVQRMLALRRAYPALRPGTWTEGVDGDGDGARDVEWFDHNGPASAAFLDDASAPVVAWRVDADDTIPGGETRSLFIAWNRSDAMQRVLFPSTEAGHAWYRVADTAAWLEGDANSHDLASPPQMPPDHYDVHGDSLIILVERAR